MSHLHDALHDVFQSLGAIQIRRMFGGHGIWHEARMCGLLIQGQLYLKSDAQTQAHFDALALPPFSYQRRGEITHTSYRLAPETVYESPDEAARWVQLAWEAALRQGAKKAATRAATRSPARRPSPGTEGAKSMPRTGRGGTSRAAPAREARAKAKAIAPARKRKS